MLKQVSGGATKCVFIKANLIPLAARK